MNIEEQKKLCDYNIGICCESACDKNKITNYIISLETRIKELEYVLEQSKKQLEYY